MKPVILKVCRITAGILLLIIGAIGGLIPIFQGWIFGLAGLALLSKDVPFIRRWYERAKVRFHEIREKKRMSEPQTASTQNSQSQEQPAPNTNDK